MRSVKITLDCGAVREPTASTIDQIARLQLSARRCGCDLELKDVHPHLLGLIDLVGLAAVLRVEAGRQTEQRENSCRVEKEGELDDPAAG